MWKPEVSFTEMRKTVETVSLGEDQKLGFGHIKSEMLTRQLCRFQKAHWMKECGIQDKCGLEIKAAVNSMWIIIY